MSECNHETHMFVGAAVGAALSLLLCVLCTQIFFPVRNDVAERQTDSGTDSGTDTEDVEYHPTSNAVKQQMMEDIVMKNINNVRKAAYLDNIEYLSVQFPMYSTVWKNEQNMKYVEEMRRIHRPIDMFANTDISVQMDLKLIAKNYPQHFDVTFDCARMAKVPGFEIEDENKIENEDVNEIESEHSPSISPDVECHF